MKSRPARISTVATIVVLAAFVAACSSSTTIHTSVPGARLYLNGEYVGTTPYTMTDTKIVGSTTSVRIEAPGYEPVIGSITRNEEFSVGACIGGVFLLVPFFWIMDYKPTHQFELRPLSAPPPPPPGPAPVGPPPASSPPPAAPPPPPPGA